MDDGNDRIRKDSKGAGRVGQKRMHNDMMDIYSIISSLDLNSKSESNAYIKQIAVNGINGDRSAAILSNRSVELFSLENLNKILRITGHDKDISDIRFSNDNDKILWTCSTDGTIKVWDTRQKPNTPSQQFETLSNNSIKPLLCFDINKSNTVVCAGTELIREDAFIMFWDIKASKLLGGYWESHTDDVTKVQFHPDNVNLIATSATDGLINLFDLSENSEEEALLTTFNTMSSVGKIYWHEPSLLSCVTHTDDVYLWDTVQGNLTFRHYRDELIKNCNIEYLVDCLIMMPNNNLLALAGTNNHDGKLLAISHKEMMVQGSLLNKHKDIIRSAILHEKGILTGGEDGRACFWTTDSFSLRSMALSEEISHKKLCQSQEES